jgi:hypothetical protein
MTSRDIPVGQRFFQAMDKTERIRTDCRVLMAGEDGPTQAGCVFTLLSRWHVLMLSVDSILWRRHPPI